ncbi:MAG: carboxypeptidase-like regulatory domain-containing protein [Saprospiraceae bacterium]|nr:carboxypeptidase-like regulatory domain-containing protein [Saprospiraceae bacterium]
MKKVFYKGLLALLCFAPLSLLAQKGSISGKIIDAKLAESLIGVTIRLDDGAGGAMTDYDGNYTIANIPAGKHKISVNYTGFSPKTIEDIEVRAGESTVVDIALEEASATTIAEVVIVARASRESQSALTILQKTSATIGDGISSETIKRTPDRTTGDVIRRVSGASIQDNKFAVIRGLNDRYNIAMLNGAMLSSTEPDRKAFSFDLFPSAMLDNLVVVKTASADLPGEFAGGAILLNTKDIPDQSFISANVSGGYNTVTTFKPFLSAQGGATDWLGIDNGTRAFPKGMPGTQEFVAAPDAEKYRYSQLFANDWKISQNNSARPNAGFQLSGGYAGNPQAKIQPGLTFSLSYSNQNRLQNGKRYDYDQERALFDYTDMQFKNNVLWGALINSAVKIDNKHKVGVQATYSTNTDNIVSDRFGNDFEQYRKVSATTIEYTENHLLTSRLYGEHQLNEAGIRLNWGGGYNKSTRNIPSMRRMFYAKNFDDTLDVTIPYQAYIPFGSADPYRSGRFYSDLEENTINSNADLSIPFVLGSQKQTLKIGGLYQQRDRSFKARVMGYVLDNFIYFDYSKLALPQESIFASENIGQNSFVMDEITNPSDAYTAGSNLLAGFVLLDNKITDRLRLNWGLRAESYRQRLEAGQYGSNQPIELDTTTVSLLPSFNLTYSLNEKHQLRLAGSKTVTRPEFRELAPFAFYDFFLNAGVVGTPDLTPGTIWNADLRYEIYPGQNQLFSVSLFYKKFINPIEFTFSSQGAGTRTFSFQNIQGAQNFGAEVEIRKNLSFLGDKWENLVVFANAARIYSKLDLSNVSAYDTTRALQGQSPYIVNAGLSLTLPDWGLNTTVIYNMIGDRITQVGTVGYADIYERHRNMLDFQLSKRIGTKGEIKLTWSDILRPDFIYYQDDNSSHRFEDNEDNVMQRLNLGSTVSLSFGWRF